MAPMGLGMMAVSSLGAWISRTRGPKVTLTIAGLVIAVGYGTTALVLGTLTGTSTVSALIPLVVCTTMVGCGVGFAFGAMPALIMSPVPASEKAAASGFNSLMRSLGLTTSAAVIGAVLGAMTQRVGGTVIPPKRDSSSPC